MKKNAETAELVSCAEMEIEIEPIDGHGHTHGHGHTVTNISSNHFPEKKQESY